MHHFRCLGGELSASIQHRINLLHFSKYTQREYEYLVPIVGQDRGNAHVFSLKEKIVTISPLLSCIVCMDIQLLRLLTVQRSY